MAAIRNDWDMDGMRLAVVPAERGGAAVVYVEVLRGDDEK
jgi:hypothetical protein